MNLCRHSYSHLPLGEWIGAVTQASRNARLAGRETCRNMHEPPQTTLESDLNLHGDLWRKLLALLLLRLESNHADTDVG
ncbi:uncharacterized protein MYCGRDRAFT_105787 [Zymoseptoria tritici IPO323]|uniref:Uncharacterized protein n=1 Tax=Zymoseptoria tritici (strain CBS 115943 / IPO323) TaxID=336722 RepID=F9XK48_ZYMTI|nr:uncharacterized protein MYCGRDRAFT_105787 [Zymoseptoria tritici IPO323]EGP84492.1 hypothetical protein MYCGRDRAFT_105787 [Zymoseptoria tritici IPO323]